MPRPSVRTWCLLPGRTRSTGPGPLLGPCGPPGRGCGVPPAKPGGESVTARDRSSCFALTRVAPRSCTWRPSVPWLSAPENQGTARAGKPAVVAFGSDARSDYRYVRGVRFTVADMPAPLTRLRPVIAPAGADNRILRGADQLLGIALRGRPQTVSPPRDCSGLCASPGTHASSVCCGASHCLSVEPFRSGCDSPEKPSERAPTERQNDPCRAVPARTEEAHPPSPHGS